MDQWLNEDQPVTPADAVRYFALCGVQVTREVVYQWIARADKRGNPVQVIDTKGPRSTKRYRIGDLLELEKAARLNDTGRGRNRGTNLAA